MSKPRTNGTGNANGHKQCEDVKMNVTELLKQKEMGK